MVAAVEAPDVGGDVIEETRLLEEPSEAQHGTVFHLLQNVPVRSQLTLDQR